MTKKHEDLPSPNCKEVQEAHRSSGQALSACGLDVLCTQEGDVGKTLQQAPSHFPWWSIVPLMVPSRAPEEPDPFVGAPIPPCEH
ncbi:hypothetical protein P7K49_010817 [Saguinus oedipus]|uniref:Uncharacterized protein n=1 Tax=Saguinus oedipus TaxID=9490 RepID=A0ABQ9VNW5_SAGOE|nr:hypothetical protein P7K49_010817 [Saguinus oedipus]